MGMSWKGSFLEKQGRAEPGLVLIGKQWVRLTDSILGRCVWAD